jgi:hypothetical protein
LLPAILHRGGLWGRHPRTGRNDPCLSCSTHAYGQMALDVQLFGPDGELLDEVKR